MLRQLKEFTKPPNWKSKLTEESKQELWEIFNETGKVTNEQRKKYNLTTPQLYFELNELAKRHPPVHNDQTDYEYMRIVDAISREVSVVVATNFGLCRETANQLILNHRILTRRQLDRQRKERQEAHKKEMTPDEVRQAQEEIHKNIQRLRAQLKKKSEQKKEEPDWEPEIISMDP